MSKKASVFTKVLALVSWILFIGLCIEAGGFLFNLIFTLWYNPLGAAKFYKEVDLSQLYNFNQRDFVVVCSLMSIAALLRACMFYFIVEIFHNRQLNLEQPFNEKLKQFILRLSYLALGIGLFSFWGAEYIEGIVSSGLPMPDLRYLRLSGADVWFFMGIVLLVIAQIFKKGIELQNENELTV